MSTIAGTLYTVPLYHRNIPCQVAAEYSGKTIKTEYVAVEQLKKEPTKFVSGKVPVFEASDKKLQLFESNSIAHFLASDQLRGGSDLLSQAGVLQWTHWTESDLLPLSEGWTLPLISSDVSIAASGCTSQCEIKKCSQGVLATMGTLDRHLKTRTFLTGQRLSLADLVVFSALFYPYKLVLEPKVRASFPHVTRWFTTVLNQPEVHKVLTQSGLAFEFCLKEAVFSPCNVKQKAEKPVDAKPSDVDELLDEEGIEKKPKNPLAALPKGSFVLDEFKRVYSNQDTETVAIPHLWDHFDAEHYSMWYCEYKYPEELKMTFMTANLITGMFQRLDSLRNHAFASMCIFGTDNNNAIGGVWMWRGSKLAFEMCEDWTIDYESYSWKQLDVNDAETKKMINGYLTWENVSLKGLALKEGKIFK